MADVLEPMRIRLARLGAAAKAAEEHAADAREARDAAIDEADQLGMTSAEIARHVDLARTRVREVCAAKTAARQAAARQALGLTGGPLEVGA